MVKRQPSQKLEKLIIRFVGDIKKLGATIIEILEQGRKEGFTDLEIGDMMREKARGHVSDRHIRYLLPPEAKHTEKVRVHPKKDNDNNKTDFAEILAANEQRKSDAAQTEKIETETAAIPIATTTTARTTIEQEKCIVCSKFLSPYVRSNGGHCDECVKMLNKECNESMQQIQQPKEEIIIRRKDDNATTVTTQQPQQERAAKVYKEQYKGSLNDEEEILKQEHERRRQIIHKIDLDNFNFHTVDATLDSCTAEELRIILKNALSVNWQLKYDLKQKTESSGILLKQHLDLKKKYKVCDVCDKKGVDYKTFGHWYCAKHLKYTIALNKTMGPVINNMFASLIKRIDK
jgi:hypothetical protein